MRKAGEFHLQKYHLLVQCVPESVGVKAYLQHRLTHTCLTEEVNEGN